MGIYDKIKNPIDRDDSLRRIVNAYLDETSGSKNFYLKAVKYGEKNTEFNEQEFNKFKESIIRLDLKRVRELPEKEIKKRAFITSEFAHKIYNKIYPSLTGKMRRKFKENKKDYPNYDDCKVLKKYTDSEIIKRYNKIINAKKEFNLKLSKDDKRIVNLISYCVMKRHIHDGCAGFHVNLERIENMQNVKAEQRVQWEHKMWEKHLEDGKFKLYLNLNYNQLYKFASKYMEICKANNMPYHFKVMSPIIDFPNRAEKMCIYCNKEDFYKAISIVRAIKKANPELKPKSPPIMAGVLDGWIGIGSDPEETSYNAMRAECIESALNKYFDGMSKSEAKKMLKNNPEILSEIREAIKEEARDDRIATNKFCFTKRGNEDVKEEEYNYNSKGLNLDINKLRIAGLKKKKKGMDDEFEKYAKARMKYGKNSREVKKVCKNISINRKANSGFACNKTDRNNNYVQSFARQKKLQEEPKIDMNKYKKIRENLIEMCK